MHNKLKYIILCFFLANLVSCITFKRNSSKSGSTNYETFYINDSTMQYFIKPIEFTNQNHVIVDFTFRKSKFLISDVTMNFSSISNNENNIEELDLFCNNITHLILINKMLYKEKNNNNFIRRYSTVIKYNQLSDFFLSTEMYLKVNNEIFKPSKKARNRINKIKTDLFEFELINK